MNDYSLISILRSDPDFATALQKRKEIVKKDKATLDKAAESYQNKYQEEILEGTEKAKLLISEGSSHGLTEEDVMKQFGRFLPTIQTPILNLLYFILRESENIDRELYETRDTDNKKYGHLTEEYIPSENVKSPDDMFTYLYGHISLDTFAKLKKLKSLTKSPVDEEAFLAFKKCRELCSKYNIEYDKIPTYN
jgi:hypothetical protein